MSQSSSYGSSLASSHVRSVRFATTSDPEQPCRETPAHGPRALSDAAQNGRALLVVLFLGNGTTLE